MTCASPYPKSMKSYPKSTNTYPKVSVRVSKNRIHKSTHLTPKHQNRLQTYPKSVSKIYDTYPKSTAGAYPKQKPDQGAHPWTD
jgi:hypothetical protein